MAINDIVQTIAEARVDARSLSEFVFKPTGFKVTRRLAPTIDTLQFYVNSLSLAVTEAQGKIEYIETTVQDAINNTAIEGGVLAATFVTVEEQITGEGAISLRDLNTRTPLVVADIPNLLDVSPTNKRPVFVKSYHPHSDMGGGNFIYDATKPRAEHNGGSVIDPTRVFPSDWGDAAQLASWFEKAAGVGLGAWVRVGSDFGLVDFGADVSSDKLDALIEAYNRSVSKVKISTDVKGVGETYQALYKVGYSNFVYEGDFLSKLESSNYRSAAMRVINNDLDEHQKNVAIIGGNFKTSRDSLEHDYPSLWLSGVEAAMVLGNRADGRCGIKTSHHPTNPDVNNKTNIKALNNLIANNIAYTSSLCYELNTMTNSVASALVAQGSGTTEGQGLRMTSYGKDWYPAWGVTGVDLEGRSSVVSAVAIDNYQQGATVQSGQVSNVLSAIAISNTYRGLNVFASFAEQAKSSKNIFNAINVSDTGRGIVDGGQDKTIHNGFIVSGFSEVGFEEYTTSTPPAYDKSYLRRVSGIITESTAEMSGRIAIFKSSCSTYNLTVGDFENADPILFSGNYNHITVVAADFRKARVSAITVTGNGNIIDLVVSGIAHNEFFAAINGHNNILRVNLTRTNGESGGILIRGDNNQVSGFARVVIDPAAGSTGTIDTTVQLPIA